ncbi:MAG: FAD-dependent oxidoreductase [Saprospiraceae bacterium]|nr:FAD-dependent oxidoreductase [Saprospiraceae bacterium]
MHVHIVGGGIVGLSCAWYLRHAGMEVTVVDAGDFTDGTSHGNAGMIVPSHFVPLASPGVIAQGIKWMFRSKSPFYIKPRLDLELMQWLWRFYRSCNKNHVNNCSRTLYDFNELSKTLYKEFDQHADFSFDFEEKGLLMLFQTASSEAAEIALAGQAAALGIDAQILGPAELQALEPNIRIEARGGVYFPHDAHLYPQRFIQQMRTSLERQGVNFRPHTKVIHFDTEHDGVRALVTDQGKIEIEQLVLSAGSWTAKLVKKLGLRLLLQDGKGYSTTLTAPQIRPDIPTILTEAKVAVTPMGQDLRIGGTLELSNFSKKVNRNRLQGVLESMPRYYPDFALDSIDPKQVWQGYRPCSPDGMPYIDRLERFTNAIVATGHGMMGMSLGPATGLLVRELMEDKKPSIDLSRMRLR